MFTLCDERKEAKSCCTCFVHFQKLTAVAFTSYLLVVNLRCNCFGLFSGGSFIYLFDHVWRKPAGDLKFFQVIRIEKNIRVFKIKASCSPSMARSLRI